MESTAMREVEEETGVNKLKINRKLPKTYHIFKRNGKYRLKITTWFEMSTNFEGELNGQVEEGIEQVVWMDKKQIKQAMENSYENIKLLIHEAGILP
jgi:8-oxo-dGTP pyrophosphatase MutT (NUDIX family)